MLEASREVFAWEQPGVIEHKIPNARRDEANLRVDVRKLFKESDFSGVVFDAGRGLVNPKGEVVPDRAWAICVDGREVARASSKPEAKLAADIAKRVVEEIG